MRYNGLQPDLRAPELKAKDWLSIEVAAPAEVKPKFRTVGKNEWLKYQIRNQDGSGSCVANTVAKMLEVKRKLNKGDSIKFSHAPIYIHRSNKPNTGMIGVNALELAIKYSSCREEDMPSEYKTDAQLDELQLPANFEAINDLVRPTAYLLLPKNFDYVAGIIEKEGATMIWVDTDYTSWVKDIPTPFATNRGEVRHSITGVDAITYEGIQYIVIEDSWGEFGEFKGQRLITREMFNDAVFFGGYFTDFTFDIANVLMYPFHTVMVFGEKNDEIKRLQEFLASQGFFPSNVSPTGYYGNVTRRAVLNFQITNNVATLAELNTLVGRRVGTKTLAAINKKM